MTFRKYQEPQDPCRSPYQRNRPVTIQESPLSRAFSCPVEIGGPAHCVRHRGPNERFKSWRSVDQQFQSEQFAALYPSQLAVAES